MPRLVNIGLRHNNEWPAFGLRALLILTNDAFPAQNRTVVSGVTIARTYGAWTSRCVRSRTRSASAGDLGERDTGRDRGVERLHRTRQRDPNAYVAGLADQPRQPLALGPDDEHKRAFGELERVEVELAASVQPGEHEPFGGALLQRPHEVGGASDRKPRERARAGLPRGRRDTDRPPLGQHQPVRTERRRRAGDRAQVVRVGDAVERDEQRRLGLLERPSQQVVDLHVVERPDLQHHALVRGATGEPVELGAPGLEHRQPEVAGPLADLVDPFVAGDAVGDVQGECRDRRAQGLDDGVAPGDHLIAGHAASAGRGGTPLTLRRGRLCRGSLCRRALAAVRRVTGAVLGLRCRALALELAAAVTAGALVWPLLAWHLGSAASAHAPARTGGGVLDDDTGVGQRVADPAGLGEVLPLAGRLPRLEHRWYQQVDGGAQLVVAATRIAEVVRRQAEHVKHRADCAVRRAYAVLVTVGKRGVAGPHCLVHDAEGAGDRQVVVHRLVE